MREDHAIRAVVDRQQRKVARKRNPLPGSPVHDVLVKRLNRSGVD
ncbi:MAG: hypothetical protein ABS918_04300 [Saccharopolyspora rectivirgula]